MIIRYSMDCSMLPPEERLKLFNRLDKVAHTSTFNTVNTTVWDFFLNREEDYQLLNIPDRCIVRKHQG